MIKNQQSILKRAIKLGTVGATSMSIQVLSMMWLRTTIACQFKNGGGFLETLKLLYTQGGIQRFYRGIIPALVIAPITRFGDITANIISREIFIEYTTLNKFPIFFQTITGSVIAGLWRFSILPIDTWKTSKQVHGSEGLKMIVKKYKFNGVKALYQGGLASASAAIVSHYPWFVTYNCLDCYIPKRNFKEQRLKSLVRGVAIGFCCTLVSDTISNSIRVIKTIKQTSGRPITYKQAFKGVLAKDGYQGLFFRGLKTKILANCIQGIVFQAQKHIQCCKYQVCKNQYLQYFVSLSSAQHGAIWNIIFPYKNQHKNDLLKKLFFNKKMFTFTFLISRINKNLQETTK